MNGEQRATLKLLLRKYASHAYEVYTAPESKFNQEMYEEKLVEKEILDYIEAIIKSERKRSINSVLDESLNSGNGTYKP